MVVDSNFFMQQALDEAWKYQGLTYPNPAVGCCIVDENSQILAIEAHQKAGTPHAEVNALQSAYFKLTQNKDILHLTDSADIHKFLSENHKNIFKNTSVYTTLEPCSHTGKTPSCADLLCSLGVKKVYVGSLDSNPEASKGNTRLLNASIEVENFILKDKCEALLLPFTLWQNKPFVFFKWAQRLNGTTDEGVISSSDSRKNVHAMRNVCDLLVIGGNTVRNDRPTLDARLVNGKAPDIFILSNEKEFDQSIPLFKIKNRKVIIGNDLSLFKNYKNIMIEGTSGIYEYTKKYVSLYLCYIAPKFGGNKIFNKNKDEFETLNILQESEDIIIWMKRKEN